MHEFLIFHSPAELSRDLVQVLLFPCASARGNTLARVPLLLQLCRVLVFCTVGCSEAVFPYSCSVIYFSCLTLLSIIYCRPPVQGVHNRVKYSILGKSACS